MREGIVDRRIRLDADPEAVSALLFGAMLARAVPGETLEDAWLDRAVETLCAGLAPEPGCPA